MLGVQANTKMSDYCVPERRKTKGDKRAKARFNRYKRGGAFRGTGISEIRRTGESK
jgi:hypothetical protein